MQRIWPAPGISYLLAAPGSRYFLKIRPIQGCDFLMFCAASRPVINAKWFMNAKQVIGKTARLQAIPLYEQYALCVWREYIISGQGLDSSIQAVGILNTSFQSRKDSFMKPPNIRTFVFLKDRSVRVTYISYFLLRFQGLNFLFRSFLIHRRPVCSNIVLHRMY